MSALIEAANNEAIDLGTGLNMPGTNDQFSIDWWIKPTGSFADSRFFDKSQDFSVTRFLLGISNSSGRGRFDLTGTTLTSGSFNYSLDVWQHACGTYDGATMRLFVDAVLRGSTAKTGNIPSTADNARIGSSAMSRSDRNYNGDLGRGRIWNRALAQDEIECIVELNQADVLVDGLFYEFKLTEGADGVSIGNSVVVNSGPQTLANGTGEGDGGNLPTWRAMDLQIYLPAA